MQFDEWDNEKRERRYGLRRGDLVEVDWGGKTLKAEVVGYPAMDNNSIFIYNGIETHIYVAEWCKLVEKVEDRQLTSFIFRAGKPPLSIQGFVTAVNADVALEMARRVVRAQLYKHGKKFTDEFVKGVEIREIPKIQMAVVIGSDD